MSIKTDLQNTIVTETSHEDQPVLDAILEFLGAGIEYDQVRRLLEVADPVHHMPNYVDLIPFEERLVRAQNALREVLQERGFYS